MINNNHKKHITNDDIKSKSKNVLNLQIGIGRRPSGISAELLHFEWMRVIIKGSSGFWLCSI